MRRVSGLLHRCEGRRRRRCRIWAPGQVGTGVSGCVWRRVRVGLVRRRRDRWRSRRRGLRPGGRRRGRIHRHALHELAQTLSLSVGLAGGAVDPVALHLAEELCALEPAVVEEGLDVLLEAVDRLLHLRVEALRLDETGVEVVEGLIHLAVSHRDRVALARDALVLALLGAHASVLEEGAVRRRQLVEKRVLLVVRL